MKQDFARIERWIDGNEGNIAKTLVNMIAIKSISPESGGAGESKRADFLQKLLISWGFKVKRYTYKDKTGTERPSLVVNFGGNKRTMWVMAHIDTVSEGDRTLWKTDPFRGVIKGGKIFGRGAEDNGQEVIASMFALRALKENRAKMKYNFGLVLAADEEVGSKYGIKKLIKEGIFGKNDLYIVPDSGRPDGHEIEISEKGLLWVKITVHGKQVHASMPQTGVNAYRYAIHFLNEVDLYLHKKYDFKDKLYETPSTFEMTKHEKNVDSINIAPGVEVSYIDCRVLPRYSLDSVLNDIKKNAKRKEFAKVKIDVETANREDAAKPTSEKSEIAKLLIKALRDLRGMKAKCIGIGGGTVATPLRELGMQVAVWSTQNEVAHRPNEYTEIKFMVDDAKVFAYLCV